jgi:DHA1 family bicyclomycin/chloramphenicol resistance-like MFS transporter
VIATKRKARPSFLEFVILVSMMMSLTALSIDAMLPALAQIGSDLNVQTANGRQLVISVIFLGLAVGQLFFGPLSDKTGRKPAIYAGLACFMAGSLVSMFAISFPMMLFGRLLQGAGISAPRTVTLRSIFGSFLLLTLIILVWFAFRMPETLASEKRAPFSWSRIVITTREIIRIRPALGYTVTAGLVSGAFIGYLNSAQQIFQEQYALGELFPLYFAIISLSVGLASILNTRLVMRIGMRLLVRWSLLIIFSLSIAALAIALVTAGHPPLWLLMAYLMMSLFCIGILFGNMNSLAMEPLGDVAGIGAAVVGALSTLISMMLGTLIGQNYNGTILPVVAGLAILAGLAMVVVRWAEAD